MVGLHFPLYLCSITEMSWWKRSPCSRSRHHNLMERIPGVKIKSAFSARYCTPAVHTNPPDLVQVLWNLQLWNFPEKPFETFSKDYHATFSLSLNTASNCWSLKSCLIWGPINTPAFTFSEVRLGNFPRKYVNAGPFTPKAFTKFFMSPNLIGSGGGKFCLALSKAYV